MPMGGIVVERGKVDDEQVALMGLDEGPEGAVLPGVSGFPGAIGKGFGTPVAVGSGLSDGESLFFDIEATIFEVTQSIDGVAVEGINIHAVDGIAR